MWVARGYLLGVKLDYYYYYSSDQSSVIINGKMAVMTRENDSLLKREIPNIVNEHTVLNNDH